MAFLQAGHPFQRRCAHSAYSHARIQQESPSFLLLLDCVWQLWHQFPLALGFSEALLLRLATEAYASDYGTFLCNRHQERSVRLLRTQTHDPIRPAANAVALICPSAQVRPGSDGEHPLLVPSPDEARGERDLRQPAVRAYRASNLALGAPSVPAALER